MNSIARCPRCLAVLPLLRPGDAAPQTCDFCQALLTSPSDSAVGGRRCIHCGKTMSRRDDNQYRCNEPGCRALFDAQKQAAEKRDEWKAEQQRERSAVQERIRNELFERGELHVLDTSAVLMVPSFAAELIPVSDQRKQAFLERVGKLAAQYFSEERGGCDYVPLESAADEADSPVETLTNQVPSAACALCRGYCCSGGGEHAFLELPSLRERAQQNQWQTPEEITEAYEALIPELANENSCLFHTDRGCALPRTMRSFTCNDFVCIGLDQWERRPAGPEIVEIAIVSRDITGTQRWQVLRAP